jgi:hypothetical protein
MRLLLISILLVCLPLPRTFSEAMPSPAEFDLQVQFPAKMERMDVPIPSPLGRTTKTIIRCVHEGTTFSLIIDHPIPKPVLKDPTRGYEIAKEIALSQAGTKEIIDEETKVGSLIGRRHVFSRDRLGHIEQRLFIIGDSLYTVAVGTRWDLDLDQVSEEFFQSLKEK